MAKRKAGVARYEDVSQQYLARRQLRPYAGWVSWHAGDRAGRSVA